MQRSASYTILFAAVVCLVCAVIVSISAVSLKARQDDNAFLDKQRNVLVAAAVSHMERSSSVVGIGASGVDDSADISVRSPLGSDPLVACFWRSPPEWL